MPDPKDQFPALTTAIQLYARSLPEAAVIKVRFELENGLAVLATGNIDVYPPQGKYQFYVDKLDPAGVGALQLAYEQMVKRLEAQGLF
ncbi:hypothetical protein LCGC14_1694630, partial [marine sediment metagenome]